MLASDNIIQLFRLFFVIVMHPYVIDLLILCHLNAYMAIDIGFQGHVERLLLRQSLRTWPCLLLSFWEHTDGLHHMLLLVTIFFTWPSLLEGEIDCKLTFLLSEMESEREVHIAYVDLEGLWNILEELESLEILYLQDVLAEILLLWVVLLAHFGRFLQYCSDLLPILLECRIDVLRHPCLQSNCSHC